MLVHQAAFTLEVGESGYLIGFGELVDYPAQMPYGWRCGPATPVGAVVLTTTDTGPVLLTVEVHDGPPQPEVGDGWEPAEEISLRTDLPGLCLATLEPGDVLDAWPDDEPPLYLSAAGGESGGEGWVRMRLYCHADDPEPGLGDHGERHLIQLWPAPETAPLHPEITEADRQQRAEYAQAMDTPVEDYTYTHAEPGEAG
ncbi:hypothetical protein [Streptomyces xylophagus]|uniref:hypothetical protein n=1 Tax=Streptomyces xylophagus TaxID=285514 RepID=UPI0005B76BDF|nr:hypothetical protein [Streptomyces xylophagus]